MMIYPAIDILGGQCVRLKQGKYDDSTVYSTDPVEIAKRWEDTGAEFIHIVDLDGARNDNRNIGVIRRIREGVKVPLQLGGGLRNADDVVRALDLGINRVILGTAAVSNPFLVYSLVERFGDKIAVGLDAKDDKIAINGWEQTSEYNVFEYAEFIKALGVSNIIFTDISTDGMLCGPNLSAMVRMAEIFGNGTIASGGVATIDDVKNLAKTNVGGVIIGKALYNENINLKELLELKL